MPCHLRLTTMPAHPRSRGEHRENPDPKSTSLGSSPLARGTLDDVGVLFGDLRLIPARAGNTTVDLGGELDLAAHPRSRGEHVRAANLALRIPGSSPLARGTPGQDGPRPGNLRLIPARAGNTT